MKPFRIFLGQSELIKYTKASLSRKKSDLTGELKVDVFLGQMPSSPAVVEAFRGQEITVYVHGNLAFTGIVDKRNGKTKRGRDSRGRFTAGTVTEGGATVEGTLTQQGYSVTITARGKTKYLVDSSHRAPTSMKKTTDKKALNALLEGHDVEVDWQADELDIPIARIRDGSLIKDEIFRLCNEHCHYAYETRDGKLRITDTSSQVMGPDLMVGLNILSFNAEQSEDRANSEVTVKGHRNGEAWGRDAVVPTVTTMQDSWVGAKIPLVIQHYGDASPEALERRGKFEVDKRAAESKRVTIEVFALGQGGEPWDIGNTHYVEIPSEGVFDVMECVELTYTIETEVLTTSLVMAPAPAPAVRGSGTSLLSAQSAISDAMRRGEARRAETGIQIVPGQYPSSWTSAAISFVTNPITTIAAAVNSLIQSPQAKRAAPPMTLTDDEQ